MPQKSKNTVIKTDGDKLGKKRFRPSLCGCMPHPIRKEWPPTELFLDVNKFEE